MHPVIAEAIARGAAVMVSVSGGKDSQAMELLLARLRREQGWSGDFFAAHADIGQGDGEMDWPWTIPLCERNAQALGHELVVVRHPLTLYDHILRRVEVTLGQGKPPFPSMTCRYCTSNSKTSPLDSLARARAPGLIVVVVGLRAEESPRRSRHAEVSVRKGITTARLQDLAPEAALEEWLRNPRGRLALNWHPVLDWSLDQVWAEIGVSQAELDARRELLAMRCPAMAFSGWPASPVYVLGQSRHSCAACVFSSQADLVVAARYRRPIIERLAGLEARSGYTWQQGRKLADLLAAISPEAIPVEALVIQPLPDDYGQPQATRLGT